MVTEDVEKSLDLNTAAQYPMLATSALPSQRLFPLQKWAPRTGYGDAYEAWWRSVKQLLAAFGLEESDMSELPAAYSPLPSSPASPGARQSVSSSSPPPAGLTRDEWWIMVNTAVYWHVLPSLDISGVMHKRTHRVKKAPADRPV